MEQAKRNWWGWGVAIVIILIIVILGFSGRQTETGPIRLGFISALSGEAASLGEAEKKATEMAVVEINAAGGINGRPIEIVYEDGKCSGKEALNAVNKLITVDKVKVILGGSCSSETLAIIPVIDKNKVMLFSAGSSNPGLTGSSKYFFRNYPSDLANAAIDGELMSRLYKKVAIVSENVDFPVGVKNILKKIFGDKGVTIVLDEVYNSGTKDFRSILSKVKSSGAEAVYLNPGLVASLAGSMVRQAREMGITVPIHGNPVFISTDSIKTGGKYMEGVISSDSTALAEKGFALIEKYKSIYGEAPLGNFLFGSNYDRVYITAQAIKAVGYDADKIADYLRNLKEYDGAIGKYHFDENGDVVGVGFMSVIIKDGKTVPYK